MNWSGLSFPSPGNLPNSGTEPVSFMFPALAGGFFTTITTWEAQRFGRNLRGTKEPLHEVERVKKSS